MKQRHQPVLLQEAIQGLAIKSDGIYVDATFGRGGHSTAILNQLSEHGRLIAIDKDPQAIETAKELFSNDERFYIGYGSYTEMASFLKRSGVENKIDGVLLDLGVSSPQLEDAERGFSFLRDGPLDMRMNPQVGVSAAKWLENVTEQDLIVVLKTYGEERYARRIARAIVAARKEQPILRTKQLADIIDQASPTREKKKHPATRSFQAIRIFINKELEELQTCLEQSLEVLSGGGRLVVISFHSLEDRIVKQFIRKEVKGDRFPSDLPIRQTDLQPRLKKIGKAIQPTEQEIADNPRARSAVLRIAEKL